MAAHLFGDSFYDNYLPSRFGIPRKLQLKSFRRTATEKAAVSQDIAVFVAIFQTGDRTSTWQYCVIVSITRIISWGDLCFPCLAVRGVSINISDARKTLAFSGLLKFVLHLVFEE